MSSTAELARRAQGSLLIGRIGSEQGKNRLVCLLIINHQKSPPLFHSVKEWERIFRLTTNVPLAAPDEDRHAASYVQRRRDISFRLA